MSNKSPEIPWDWVQGEIEAKKLNFEDELKFINLDISHFSPEERVSLEARYNIRYTRSIDHNLNLIDATVEERKSIFIEWLENSKTEDAALTPTKTPASIEEAVKKAEEEGGKKVMDKVISTISGIFPSFWAMIAPITWFFGAGLWVGMAKWFNDLKSEDSLFWAWILKFFGVGKDLDESAAKITELAKKEEIVEPITASDEAKTQETETKDWTEVGTEWVEEKTETIDTIENRMAAYSQLGKIIIKKIWGEIFEGDDNFNSTVDIMTERGLRIDKVRSYDPTDAELESKNISRENYEKATWAFVSSEMTIILESLFSIQNLQHLVSRPKAKEVIDELWIDITNTYPQNIEVSKLLILLPLTLSWFTYLSSNSAVNFAWSSMSRMVNFAQSIEFSKIKEDLSQDIEDFSDHIISQDIEGSYIFLSQDSNTLHFTEQQLADKGLDTENEQVKKFLAFKEFAINDILKNPRYNLGMENEIISKFSLNDVFQLYVLFWWYLPEDISEIDSFKSSIIYTWVFSTLKRYDVQWAYGAKIQQELEQQEYIQEEDTALISVIVLRIIEESVNDIKIVIEKWLRAWFETVKANPAEAWLLALWLYAVNKIPAVRWARITHKLFLLWGWVWGYLYLNADEWQRKHADQILAWNSEFESMKQELQQMNWEETSWGNWGEDTLKKAWETLGSVAGSIFAPIAEWFNERTK